MSEFLLLLGKVNLGMGAAIILVWLLRRPARAQFGAAMAYALWLLVPVAGLASLLPPRTEAPVQVMAAEIPAAQNFAAPVAQNFAAPVSRPVAPAQPVIPQRIVAPHVKSVQSVVAAETAPLKSIDYVPALFAVWLLGAGLMVLYLAWLQIRFYAVARAGEAGPAVAGFLRPRMVMPQDFEVQFTKGEQAAILAHERVHLRRQDARINALAALLRTLCWFNPLMHLADVWLRIDQELACDAAALAAPVSRRDYAKALLKSQISKTRLPLGCNWPGSEHPLVERIALLKHKRPSRARRSMGFGLVMIAAGFAGLSAWAAQPPVPAKNEPAKAIATSHKQIALATPPARNPVANQNVGDASNQPVADANPITGDATKSVSAAPVPVPGSGGATSAPLLIQEPDQKIDLALNEAAGTALAKAATDASSSLSDESVARQMAVNAKMSAPAPMAAVAQPGKAPRPQTLAALKCLNGLGPKGCESLFENSAQVGRSIQNCAAKYVFEGYWICPNGPLEALGYLGANAAGEDVFSTKNLSQISTYVIPPPGPDGKVGRWCVSGRPPESTLRPNCSDGHGVDSSAVKVTTRPDHALVLYTRPRVSDDHTLRGFTGPSVNPGVSGGVPSPAPPVYWPPVPN